LEILLDDYSRAGLTKQNNFVKILFIYEKFIFTKLFCSVIPE